MPDREKVVGHLNDCMEASRRDNTWVFVRKDIVEDTLALLKEQEAVDPKVIRMNAFGHPVHACGKCGLLITESMNYCSRCGKSVKRDA